MPRPRRWYSVSEEVLPVVEGRKIDFGKWGMCDVPVSMSSGASFASGLERKGVGVSSLMSLLLLLLLLLLPSSESVLWIGLTS